MTHHLVIAKAGGAMVQEAIAARCPIIINQVIPGQEEGNAHLIKKLGVGAVAERSKEVRDLVEEAFAHKSRQWQEWRDNLDKVSRSDATLRIAALVLEEAGHGSGWPAPPQALRRGARARQATGPPPVRRFAGSALRFSHPYQLFRRPADAPGGDRFLWPPRL